MNPLSIVYNGITLNALNGYHISRLVYDQIPLRTSRENKTNAHGGNIWSQKHDLRPIEIDGQMTASDATTFINMKSQLSNAFNLDAQNTLLTLTLWNGSSKVINAKTISTPSIESIQGEATTAQFSIALECEDPYFTDISSNIFTCTSPVSGGTLIPVAIPVTLSPSSGGTFTINNIGDTETYARFDIKGSCSNPSVLNATYGDQFQILTTLASSDKVSVYEDNTGTYVLNNGSVNYFQYFSGTLFKIRKGTNVIKFSVSSAYDPSCSLTCTFLNKYYTVT